MMVKVNFGIGSRSTRRNTVVDNCIMRDSSVGKQSNLKNIMQAIARYNAMIAAYLRACFELS